MHVTIIMYHYIRDLKYSRYPDIKGRTIKEFRKQIHYIKNKYKIVGIQEIIDAINTGEKIPDNAALLTFDDGYIDHYTNVFPILDDLNIQGIFFPSGEAVVESKVLDVNKIHFILAAKIDTSKLIQEIFSAMELFRNGYNLEDNDAYYTRLAKPNAYDTADIVFIKRMLQRELPEAIRSEIIDNLFGKYVTKDEKAFSQELYMNVDQMRCMKRSGMYFGSHGYRHYWMNAILPEDQRNDIVKSLNFLKLIDSDTKQWIMCYPYGGYNNSLLYIIRDIGCVLGFTANPGIADVSKDNPLLLPRIDTNEIPTE